MNLKYNLWLSVMIDEISDSSLLSCLSPTCLSKSILSWYHHIPSKIITSDFKAVWFLLLPPSIPPSLLLPFLSFFLYLEVDWLSGFLSLLQLLFPTPSQTQTLSNTFSTVISRNVFIFIFILKYLHLDCSVLVREDSFWIGSSQCKTTTGQHAELKRLLAAWP